MSLSGLPPYIPLLESCLEALCPRTEGCALLVMIGKKVNFYIKYPQNIIICKLFFLGPFSYYKREIHPVSGLGNMIQTSGIWGAGQLKDAGERWGDPTVQGADYTAPPSPALCLKLKFRFNFSRRLPHHGLGDGHCLANRLKWLVWSVDWPSGIFKKLTWGFLTFSQCLRTLP